MDELTIGKDFTTTAQVANHVPVQCGLVVAACFGIGCTEREVYRAANFPTLLNLCMAFSVLPAAPFLAAAVVPCQTPKSLTASPGRNLPPVNSDSFAPKRCLHYSLWPI